MRRIPPDLNEELRTPEFIYYYKIECPICSRFVWIVDELDLRTVIPIDRVNVSFRRDARYMWWVSFCDRKLGSRVVPLLVFWKEGFERGTPHILALEKQYTGVVTKSIEERIATLSRKLIPEFERYMYRPVVI